MTAIHRIELPIPFPLKWVNCYYIQDSRPTLVDAGINSDEGLQIIASFIEGLGERLGDLRRIIVTHGHLDHVGLANRIAGTTGAQVFIHRRDRDNVALGLRESYDELYDRLSGFFSDAGVSPDFIEQAVDVMTQRFRRFFSPFSGEKALDGGETFPFDDFELRVVHTPGHSPGSICLLEKQGGVLLSGDTLLETITSNPVAEIKPPGEKSDYRSLACYEASLALLRSLNVKTVLPGHGPPFQGHSKRVEEILEHHRLRRAAVLEILQQAGDSGSKSQGMTQFDVATRLFSDLGGFEVFLALSEARAHLEVLEDEGLVRSASRNGERRFSLRRVAGSA